MPDKVKPISFEKRFGTFEERDAELSRNHAAGLCRYCPECGACLGYIKLPWEDYSTCPSCKAELDWEGVS